MDAFAEYYDIMVGADYDKISDFIIDAINKYKPESELVCDLGCGTAKVTTLLSQKGFDMIGIDSSEDMLIKARENVSKSGVDSVLLLNQDITDFELYGTVDVIYATLDTINYVTCKRDLNKLFRLVKNYLNYDGLFIFDVNTKYKFESVLAENDFIYDFDDLFCCWSVEFDKKSEKCYHLLTYFDKCEDGRFMRKENEQTQRYYSNRYLYELFSKYNFDVIGEYDDYNWTSVTPKTERITYILKINK